VPWRRGQDPGHNLAGLDQRETIARERPWLRRIGSGVAGGPVETVGATAVAFAIPAQEAAGDVEDRLMIEVLPVHPEVAQESDPFGVTEEKGRFVVRRARVAILRPLAGGNAEHDPKAIAVGAHGPAGRSRRVPGRRHSQL
jgi:hypothetical protein